MCFTFKLYKCTLNSHIRYVLYKTYFSSVHLSFNDHFFLCINAKVTFINLCQFVYGNIIKFPNGTKTVVT